MRRKIMAIINTEARQGKGAGAKAAAIRALESSEIGAEVFTAPGREIATAVRRALDRFDVIIAGGGDGTLNTVASILTGTGKTFGVIPLGTLNHFARDAGIPLDISEAVRLIRNGEAKLIDVGDMNGHAFINNSSVGMYPWMARMRVEFEKKGMGKWKALALALFRTVRKMPVFTVTMKVGDAIVKRKTPFVFIGANRYEMNSLMAWKRDSLEDAILTVCVSHESTAAGWLKLVWAALRGKLRSHEGYDVIGLTELTIDWPEKTIDVALDGEVKTLVPPLTYRIVPKSLKVILPKIYIEL